MIKLWEIRCSRCDEGKLYFIRNIIEEFKRKPSIIKARVYLCNSCGHATFIWEGNSGPIIVDDKTGLAVNDLVVPNSNAPFRWLHGEKIGKILSISEDTATVQRGSYRHKIHLGFLEKRNPKDKPFVDTKALRENSVKK